MFVDFLIFLSVVNIDGSFPMRRYMQSLDLRFKSYEVSKISGDLWACCQPLLQQILPKSAQICPNLPKAKTLKYHQKSRF
jgi:hypothetical protein